MAGVGGVGGSIPDPNIQKVGAASYTPEQKAQFNAEAKRQAQDIKDDLKHFIYNWKSGVPQDDPAFFDKMKKDIEILNKYIGDHQAAFGEGAITGAQELYKEIHLIGAYSEFEVDMGIWIGEGGEPMRLMDSLNEIISGCK